MEYKTQNTTKTLLLMAIIASSLLLTACTSVNVPEDKKPILNFTQECSKDSDCIKGGCSSQLCVPKQGNEPIFSTCEWMPEYACFQNASCICTQGQCGFEETQELTNCLAEVDV